MSLEYPCVYYEKEKCKKFSEPGCTSWCVLGPCSHETPSNADRIRSMSDEELVDWARVQIGCGAGFFPCGVVCGKCETYSSEECKAKILKWLKQPAE